MSERQQAFVQAPHDTVVRARNRVFKSNVAYRQVNKGGREAIPARAAKSRLHKQCM